MYPRDHQPLIAVIIIYVFCVFKATHVEVIGYGTSVDNNYNHA